MAGHRPPIIALLTDFGTTDWYVAAMKGVILGICPDARLVDITHQIPPQDITSGAFTLAAAVPYFPAGTIFACVVDPGVGSDRPLVAARADAQFLVGPDNGLLSLVLRRARRRAIVRITNRRYWRREISSTFHGRDIMGPVAAHLACGTPLARVGPPVTRYQALDLPPVRRTVRGVTGEVVSIDAFGNVITNVPASSLRGSARPRVEYKRRPVRVVSSYAAGKTGELVAVRGSIGYIELAIRNGSAAKQFHAKRGDSVGVLH